MAGIGKPNIILYFCLLANSKKSVSKKSSGWWKWTKRVFLFFFISHLVYVVALKWIDPPFTSTMLTSSVHCLQSKEADFSRDYITFDEMGTNSKLAVLSAEDQLFPTHNGFDFDAIQKAIVYNQKNEGKKMRGASTISQQVAKNVFLWQGRDYIRKGLEVYFTFLIELIWGKKRILEMYLNIAQMGDGVFGIEAAAQKYFHKSAKQLSKSEAAWIATILPNPAVYKIHKPTAQLTQKHNRILTFMNNLATDTHITSIINP